MAYFSLDATGDGPTWHCIQTSDLSVNRQNSISWGEAGIILQKTEMLKNIESVLGQFFGSGIVNFCQNWYFQAVLENILSLKDKWLLLLFFFFYFTEKGRGKKCFLPTNVFLWMLCRWSWWRTLSCTSSSSASSMPTSSSRSRRFATSSGSLSA